MSLKIIFFGTAEFAVNSLDILVKSKHPIVAVVTAPDKPAGRGQKIRMSPVKEYALSQNLKILQPEKLKNTDFLQELRSLSADLQIVVAFRMMPVEVWNMPPMGTINLHASLLPAYRGAAPINWAIINGEKKTGLSTFFLKHEIDTGDIIMQEAYPINDDDTAGILHDRLSSHGAKLLLKTVQAIVANTCPTIPQSEINNQPSTINFPKAPKIFREMCKIDWNKTSTEIHNLVRGLNPVPSAWILLNKGICKIHKTNKIVNTDAIRDDQQFVTDQRSFLYVKTKDSWISIEELQLESKKRMKIEEFLKGNKVNMVE